MENKMRALLIKPDMPQEFVTEVDYNDDWQTIAPSISYEGHDVDLFECVRLNQHNVMYVDESGLLVNPQHFLIIKGYRSPVAGRGLILGEDREGGADDCDITEEWVRENIRPAILGPDGRTIMFYPEVA